jgi:hypothetical protein
VVLLQSLTVAVTDAPANAQDIEAQDIVAQEIVAPEPESALQPIAALEPDIAQGADTAAPEVSAETVLGLMDDDSHDAAEAAEPGQGAQAEPSPDVEPAATGDQMPAHDLTGTYDHLWEKTVIRRIEDAAVRDEPEEPDAGPALATTPEPGTRPEIPDLPVPAAPRPAEIPAPGVGGGLIDSVPWRTGAGSVPAAQAPPSFTPAPAPATSTAPAADPGGFDGDHDGQTIMKSDLAATNAPAAPEEPVPGAGPLVLALVCGSGHANPPTHAQSAVCGAPLPPDAIQVARPRLGRMRVSTGELVDLDQSLVIGRQPSVSRVQGGVMPRLVQVASPGGDISRSHVEVRLEGWHVMLCDLKATNGTVLVREGQQPRRLAQNEMAILLDGDIAELGDDISLRFAEIL